MLFAVSAVKLVAEIALMCFVGQMLLALLAGARRHDNLFYRILQTVTSPFVRVARLITPRIVLDRHIPIAAFLLAAMLWVAATVYKINLCVQIGVQQCR
ncbi:MAG: hypothetical protein AB7G13_18695 [Lautropia sp.]